MTDDLRDPARLIGGGALLDERLALFATTVRCRIAAPPVGFVRMRPWQGPVIRSPFASSTLTFGPASR